MVRFAHRRRASALVVATLAAALVVIAGPRPAAAADWRPPPGALPNATTYLYLASQPGDFVGGGRTTTSILATTDIDVSAVGAAITVRVEGDDRWRGVFRPPGSGSTVVPARYDGLTRGGTSTAGLAWTGEGRACNSLAGWYEVDEVTYSGGAVASLTLRFEQRCTGDGGALHGQLRWRAGDPRYPPTPTRPVPTSMWRPAPGAVPASGSYLYLSSQAGDPIGDGRTLLYESPTELAAMRVYGTGSFLRWIWLTPSLEWSFDMVASNRASSITPGFYDDLIGPFRNQVRGGFAFGGDGNGCGDLVTDVAVDEIDVRGDAVVDVVLRFSQRCVGDAGSLRGELRWQVPAPAGALPPPTGISATGGNGSATVRWSPRSGATAYEVTAFREGMAVATARAEGGATSVVVPGLLNGRVHTFKVASIDKAVTGQRSRMAGSATPDLPRPTPTAVSPSAGPRTGGTPVTITGSLLAGATAVSFGGVPASSFTVVSDTRIDAVTPPLAVGPRQVAVTTPLGPSRSGPTYTSEALLGPFATPESLVARQHLDFTGRPGTSAEIAATATAIRSGAQSPGAVIAAFRERPEWRPRRAPVIRLYSAYFLRRPDAAGLDFWAGRLAAGASLSQVSSSFAASPEFVSRYGALSDADFVRLVYQNVLGRPPDAAGLSYWVAEMGRGVTRGRVMIGFSESPENVARTAPTVEVVLVHDGMLGRVPTAAELADAQAVLASEGAAGLATRILLGSEYAARVG